ncbi:MAG: TatD family hydrolase [Bacilli bacterium]|nr:TatD family hydrolase [Bacilli bacterium]
MIIDSHVHINSKVIDDLDYTLKHINKQKNLESVINVGLDIETSKECAEISKRENKFYSSVGIHPLYIEKENCNQLFNLINDKVVAIGEIGLDSTRGNYYEQKKYLIRQIFIANELKLPVIIHSNNSNKQIIEIFENSIKPKYGCVFHCFQPDLDILKYIIDNEYFISFAGRITYKTAKKSIEIIKEVPIDNFLVETDSPFIPIGLNKEIESKPSNINYIINRISKIKEIDYKEIEEITSRNTKVLFKKMR